MHIVEPIAPRPAERLFELPAPIAIGAIIAILALAGAAALLVGRGTAALALVGVALAAWRFAGAATVAVVAAAAALAAVEGPDAAPGIGLSAILVCALVAAIRSAYGAERRAARYDRLTGALNRRGFEAELATVAEAATQARQPYLLAYADLDGFKSVNDGFGHDAGDHVLRTFATAARGALLPGDILGRIGGDEFVMLLRAHHGVDPYTQAELVHQQLSAALAKLGYPMLGCSMGTVIVEPPPLPSHEALLGWADALMYEVKKAGKGAMRIAHASLESA